ncbi:OmpA-OmpF porin, OOP family [Pseudoalteromonas citrea]|uniref:OmpA-OmpF porin, OOP family n=2 Tax=Pseudoalteromonas citrea TaxID=43655 RepID=A0AAD4FSM1_9GAMM|nr:OmpA family protein [Pseudoalteromonas citrea]KAF7772449.1 OmpA-OmpF porin, OOP family [Pseudoalteromonas citrea]
MKLKLISLAIAIAAVSTVQAGEQKEGIHFGVFGDYYDASWENVRGAAAGGVDVDNSTGWGAELGYRFNDYWSARLEYADMDFDLSGTGSGSQDGERYGIDGLYHFDGGPFYGLFGLKSVEAFESNTFANIGAGYRHHFSDNLFVNAETSIYQGLERSYIDVGAKLGINYFFGTTKTVAKAEPAPTPAPVARAKDSDKDGVLDTRDKCANTPMADAVDTYGCTKYVEKDATVKLLVRFPHNNSAVSSDYLSDIEDVVTFLQQHNDASVVLEGHASIVGEAKYNQWLSKKRADKVAKQLISKGIDAQRISTVGYGEERLLNTANTLAAHAENRRVEASIAVTERVKVKRN